MGLLLILVPSAIMILYFKNTEWFDSHPVLMWTIVGPSALFLGFGFLFAFL